jgi:dihydrodipicolinate synthase/N-acetylneuraminate lyase
VHLGEGSDEYKKPQEFFRRTYLTESLKRLLVGGVQRISGKGGDPVVQLQTNFGGGKTHSMLALYHLFSGANASELAGVDAVLVRTPSFFKPQMTTDAFVRHFSEIADATPVPVLLYNVTLYTGVNLLPDAVERLAVHPNIVGMKESGSDIGQIAEYVARTPDDFTVLAGSATTLVHALCAGCDGAILALASLAPAECVLMLTLVREKRLDEAHALQRRLMPLARSVGTSYGVPGLKAALELKGYAGGPPRPPASSSCRRPCATSNLRRRRKSLRP